MKERKVSNLFLFFFSTLGKYKSVLDLFFFFLANLTPSLGPSNPGDYFPEISNEKKLNETGKAKMKQSHYHPESMADRCDGFTELWTSS